MSTLTVRLRDTWNPSPELMLEAADELERLTAELEATKKAVQQNYFRVVEVTVERDLLKADAEQMYKRGWINAARWADRADLIADIDSGAYAAELDAAIQGAKK